MYDDGIVSICNLVNTAENGSMPLEQLSPVSRHWFENRTIGINRAYLAKGADEMIDKLIRIGFNPDVSAEQYALLGDGSQYRITNAQHFDPGGQGVYSSSENDRLRYTELTLSKLKNNYDVLTQEG